MMIQGLTALNVRGQITKAELHDTLSQATACSPPETSLEF